MLLLNNFDSKTLQSVADSYKESIIQNDNIHKSLQQLNDNIHKSLQQLLISIDKEANFLSDPALKKPFTALQTRLQEQLTHVKTDKQILINKLATYQNQLKKLISSRQSLAQYNIDSWPIIINKLIAIPNLFYKYLKTLSLKVYDSYTWLDTIPATVLWILLSLTVILFTIFSKLLKSVSGDKERSRLKEIKSDHV